jgi:hypothetical protein
MLSVVEERTLLKIGPGTLSCFSGVAYSAGRLHALGIILQKRQRPGNAGQSMEPAVKLVSNSLRNSSRRSSAASRGTRIGLFRMSSQRENGSGI